MKAAKLDRNSWNALLNKIDTILLDCDGVLWCGNSVVNRATDAVTKLKALNKRVILVTNNSTRSRGSYVDKCKKLGFCVTNEEDIVTTSCVLGDYLKNVVKFRDRAYVIGSQGISNELDLVGIRHTGIGVDHYASYTDSETRSDIHLENDIKAVLVGFDGHFSYPKIMKAASYLKNPDCLFVATNDDETFPSPNKNIACPGTGCMVLATSLAAQRKPVILGKPYKPMFDYIKRIFPTIDKNRTLMVGDRLRTDIQFARINGLSSLLVLTGESSLADLGKEEFREMIPDFYTDSLDDILKF